MSQAPRPTQYSSLLLRDLICLCADGPNDEAWVEFVSRTGKSIGLTILRTASLWGQPSPSLVEDIAQSLYLKLWEDNCRRLRDFALQHPEAIVGYLKKTAGNATHDYFKHVRSQSSGGHNSHLSTSDVDPEIRKGAQGSHERLEFGVFVKEIDQYLKHCLEGPDQERDRMIFWLYYRQGMSTKEIAAIHAIGLTSKGVGSALERVKRSIREKIVGISVSGDHEPSGGKSKTTGKLVDRLYGS
jgi:RNA polymerase sigma-70 factor, ECF subfamily